MEENVDSRLTLDKNCSTLKKQIFFFERRNGMNGKKILLITTLVATLVLISLVALFAKFILDIDFGELGSSEQSDPQQIEQQEEEPQQNKPDDKQEPQQKPLDQTEDGKQEQKEEEDRQL